MPVSVEHAQLLPRDYLVQGDVIYGTLPNNFFVERAVGARASIPQDPSHARQFSMLLPHTQQQNGSSLASCMGQNLNTPGMSLPQGPGSLQQIFIQPSPLLPHANPSLLLPLRHFNPNRERNRSPVLLIISPPCRYRNFVSCPVNCCKS